MPFPDPVKKEALRRSRRACCVCNSFAGLYTNVHHITPEADGGGNDLENAIVLCLVCHGQVGHYNPRHPIGNKYHPDELRSLRNDFWDWVQKNPGVPMPRSPISISPGQIDLGRDGWKTQTPLNVYNKSDEFYYQIVVKVMIHSKQITAHDLEIRVAKASQGPEATVGQYTLAGRIFIVGGMAQDGTGTLMIYIGQLSLKEVCTLYIQNRLKSMELISDGGEAYVDLLCFDSEPRPMFEQGGAVALPFKLPEPMMVAYVSVFFKPGV